MVKMFTWLRKTLNRNRARAFVENASAWYITCKGVVALMGDALHDPAIITKDIGQEIDKIDHMLIDLGLYIPDSLGALRRHNQNLAHRFDLVSQQVFELRNKMTIFLIRSQGPGPMSGEDPDEETRLIYYYQALDEVGFTARDLKADLDRELSEIWQDLQQIIIQQEIIADTG